MCGIVSYIGRGDLKAVTGLVRSMDEALIHRGPDDQGVLVWDDRSGTRYHTWDPNRRDPVTAPALPEGTQPGCLVLAHRRLAILDPHARAHQPMCTPDQRYWITYNGEIYNHVELRHELEARGHAFVTRGDTEVLLHGFAEWGEGVLSRLVGMFAFMVFDAHRRTCFVARDPFGMKPLYVMQAADGLVFASEPAPLATAQGPVRCHPEAMRDYLVSGITDHTTDTCFASVQAFPHGHAASVSLAEPLVLDAKPYWTLGEPETASLDFASAVRETRERFLQSIAWHLRSDVPVGTLLSGGIDSSSIVMAMREAGGDQLDIHTFSYIGSGSAVDEGPWIDEVRRSAHTIHHPVTIERDAWDARAMDAARDQGEPFGSMAVFAQHGLFQVAGRSGVRVVLDGQGADELMAGYRWAWAYRFLSLVRAGRLAQATRFLRVLHARHATPDPGVAAVLRMALAVSAPDVVRRRPVPWVASEWFEQRGIRDLGRPLPARTLTSRLRTTLTTRGLPALLRYEDRSSMAASVEARLPFLTTGFVEFIHSLPTDFILGADGTSKRVFREAMRGLVPDSVLDRREKVGFSVPHASLARSSSMFRDMLMRAGELPPVDAAHVARLGQGLRTPSSRLSTRDIFLAWRLVGLEAWRAAFDVRFDAPPP